MPAHLARAVGTRNDVASLRMLGDEVDERLALTFCPDRIRRLLKYNSLDDCQHSFVCTPNIIDLSSALLSKCAGLKELLG